MVMDTGIDDNIQTPTNTGALNAWGKRNVPDFLGVYASDQLPDISGIGHGCLVANYDPSHMPGTHWIAMCFKGGRGYYFDSYGYGPDMDDKILRDKTHFGEYIRRFSGEEPIVNHIDLQGRHSDVCGEWSLTYCWACSRGHSIVSAEDPFWKKLLDVEDKDRRDQMVVDGIRNPKNLTRMLPPASDEKGSSRKRVHFY